MKLIICTIPTATSPINGIEFGPHERGLVSTPVSDETAEYFGSIPGYELEEWTPAATTAAPTAPAAAWTPASAATTAPGQSDQAADDQSTANPERDALRAELSGLGVPVNNRWGVDRLKAEVEAAKSAKAGQS